MTQVTVKALEPVNGHSPGDTFAVSEEEARKLRDKGLVKMQGAPQNKMKAKAQNKANPSPAAGRALKSSALPAARRSPAKTATSSARGAKKTAAKKTRGR